MSRIILRRLPRLGAVTAGRKPPAFSANRPTLTRFLSTRPEPPSASPDPITPAPAVSLEDRDQPFVEPEVLTATPISADDSLSSAADAAAAAADIASAETVTSFSDTLLQPAIALLNVAHEFTGLPWWLSIGVSTVAIRMTLLPVTLMTMRNSARMGALKDEIAEKREAVMNAVRAGDRPSAGVRQKEMQQFMRDAGVTPLKVLLGPLVQFPVFISFFIGLRRLSQADPSFTTGGAAWFVDLAARDPIFVLPVVCGVSLLAMTELGGDTGSTQISPQMRMGMRAVAILSIPMTYWFPSAVFCYWIPNNVFSMGLGLALRAKPTRKLLGLNVELAKIPGTKAFRAEAARVAGQKRNPGSTISVDPVAAIASYSKPVSSSAKSTVVKPVLLKHRPRKKVKRSVN